MTPKFGARGVETLHRFFVSVAPARAVNLLERVIRRFLLAIPVKAGAPPSGRNINDLLPSKAHTRYRRM